MTDASAGPASKLSHDAQGREVFSVHPEIRSGGAPYRMVTQPLATDGDQGTTRPPRRPRRAPQQDR